MNTTPHGVTFERHAEGFIVTIPYLPHGEMHIEVGSLAELYGLQRYLQYAADDVNHVLVTTLLGVEA